MLHRIKYCLLILMMSSVSLLAEKSVVDRSAELKRPHHREVVRIPDLPGYLTLKCDFHIHTMFSDGVVWPAVRVREAWEEGLDAIAITDHIENQPSKAFVGGDHNSSYETALPEAREKNLILIRAGEISRKMPPGHLNALFLSDVNKLDLAEPEDALEAALAQGAFVFWNHPGWEAQQPDDTVMFPVHERWIREKKIHGMEVFNEKEWYPVVLQWVLDHDLAVIGNSDIHDVTEHFYDVRFGHRPMTLVFAGERSEAAIREALFAGRCAAWWGDEVAGKEEYLRELFNRAVEFGKPYFVDEDGDAWLEVRNSSDLTFVIEPLEELSDPGKVTIYPDGIQLLRFEAEKLPQTIPCRVANFHTGMNRDLVVRITLDRVSPGR